MGVCGRLGARSGPDRHRRQSREPRRALPGKVFPVLVGARRPGETVWQSELLGFGVRGFALRRSILAPQPGIYPREQVAVTSGTRRCSGTCGGSGDASDPGPGFRLARGQTQVLAFGPLSPADPGLFPCAAPRGLVRVGPRCSRRADTGPPRDVGSEK